MLISNRCFDVRSLYRRLPRESAGRLSSLYVGLIENLFGTMHMLISSRLTVDYDVLAHNEIYGFDDATVAEMGRIAEECGMNAVCNAIRL